MIVRRPSKIDALANRPAVRPDTAGRPNTHPVPAVSQPAPLWDLTAYPPTLAEYNAARDFCARLCHPAATNALLDACGHDPERFSRLIVFAAGISLQAAGNEGAS